MRNIFNILRNRLEELNDLIDNYYLWLDAKDELKSYFDEIYRV